MRKLKTIEEIRARDRIISARYYNNHKQKILIKRKLAYDKRRTRN